MAGTAGGHGLFLRDEGNLDMWGFDLGSKASRYGQQNERMEHSQHNLTASRLTRNSDSHSNDMDMHKYRLFAPGPTPVPESVLAALARPVLHHRTSAFEAIFAQVQQGLRWIFQCQQEVLCLAGTGTAAMDGAVCNFLSPGDVAIFVNGGKFGERWGEILRAYGVKAVEITVPWGEAVSPTAIQETLAAYPEARAVYMQACETSTGVMHPVSAVAALCQKLPHTLCIVDGITAVGVADLALDRDHIDVLISGSQKAFMLPPGLAFVAISDKAWTAQASSKLPKFYLDFAVERAATRQNQSAWTSPVSLMVGLAEALALMQQEGLPALFARHDCMARACRAGLEALGCRLFAQIPASGVTAVVPPVPLSGKQIVNALQRTLNLTVVGGQDAIKEKVFRVAHMGYFDDTDMLTLLACVEQVFGQLGRPAYGIGVAAAQKILVSR